MVGDPTGHNESRPRLTRAEVDRSAETYLDQAFKVLDRAKVELRRNSEWLDTMTMVDAVELMAKSTVSRMLERKDFRQRFDEQRAIHQHEFLYPGSCRRTTRSSSNATTWSFSAGPISFLQPDTGPGL